MKTARVSAKHFGWLLLAVFGLVGCASPGNLNEKSSARIQPGMAEAVVHKIFGVPRRSELGANGRKLEMFGTVHHRPTVNSSFGDSSGVLEVRALHVLYDREGRVMRTAYSVGDSPYRYALLRPGWYEGTSGSRIPRSTLEQIQKGVTTRAELVRLCGKPTIIGFDVEANTTHSWLFVHDRKSGFLRVQEFLVLLDEDAVVADFILRDSLF